MPNSINKAIEISDAKIQFVSLVDKAANKKQFLITKAEEGKAQFSTYGRILKADDATHYITGIVYEPLVEDTDGNFMTEEAIRKAAHWFSKNGNKVDVQHNYEAADGVSVVESYIAPCDLTIGDQPVTKGTWIMTVEVTNADIWDAVQKGEITGFSMGGFGKYGEEEIDLDSISKNTPAAPVLDKGKVEKQENGIVQHGSSPPDTSELPITPDAPEKVGVVQKIAKWLGIDVVEKGAVTDAYMDKGKRGQFWDAFSALQDVLYQYDWTTDTGTFENDEATIRAALSEFSAIIVDLLADKEQSIVKALAGTAPINKAGKKISSENKKKLDEAYQLLTDLRDGLDNAEDEDIEKKEDPNMTKEQVQQMIDAAITKAAAEPSTDGVTETNANMPVGEPFTEERVQKMIDDTIQKALEANGEKEDGTTTPAAEPITEEAVQKMISEQVEKAIAPILKARGLPSNLNGEPQQQVEKSEDAFSGFFV